MFQWGQVLRDWVRGWRIKLALRPPVLHRSRSLRNPGSVGRSSARGNLSDQPGVVVARGPETFMLAIHISNC